MKVSFEKKALYIWRWYLIVMVHGKYSIRIHSSLTVSDQHLDETASTVPCPCQELPQLICHHQNQKHGGSALLPAKELSVFRGKNLLSQVKATRKFFTERKCKN